MSDTPTPEQVTADPMSSEPYSDLPYPDYPLALKDLHELAAEIDEIAPTSAAAADTRALLAMIRRATSGEPGLRGVWQAVWSRDIGDWSEDQVRELIAAYETSTRKAEGGPGTPDSGSRSDP